MSFEERNRLVQQLGLPDYATYIDSELWARIRHRVLKKAKSRCCCCDNRAIQVHHSQYTAENLKGDSLVGLHAICLECHELVHLNRDKFIELDESAARLETFITADKRTLPALNPRRRPNVVGHRGPPNSGKAAKKSKKPPVELVLCERCGKMRKVDSMLRQLGYCTVCKNRIAKNRDENNKPLRKRKLRLTEAMLNVPLPKKDN